MAYPHKQPDKGTEEIPSPEQEVQHGGLDYQNAFLQDSVLNLDIDATPQTPTCVIRPLCSIPLLW